MSWIQFGIMAAVAALVTVPAVLLIPKMRQSPGFDRFLWAATWVIAFLGGWAALGYAGPNSSLAPLNSHLVLAGVPVLTIIAGAAAAALGLNILLWLMDRFSHMEMGEEPEQALEESMAPENRGLGSPSGENAGQNGGADSGIKDEPEKQKDTFS